MTPERRAVVALFVGVTIGATVAIAGSHRGVTALAAMTTLQPRNRGRFITTGLWACALMRTQNRHAARSQRHEAFLRVGADPPVSSQGLGVWDDFRNYLVHAA